jgi:hypothetical protein
LGKRPTIRTGQRMMAHRKSAVVSVAGASAGTVKALGHLFPGPNLCSVFIRLNRSMARSRRRSGRWLFSARLLAQRPTSCLSALPIPFIATRSDRALRWNTSPDEMCIRSGNAFRANIKWIGSFD